MWGSDGREGTQSLGRPSATWAQPCGHRDTQLCPIWAVAPHRPRVQTCSLGGGEYLRRLLVSRAQGDWLGEVSVRGRGRQPSAGRRLLARPRFPQNG